MSWEDEDESFGAVFVQCHPPLSIYIKGILERYPEEQIFKVNDTTVIDNS